MSKENYPPPPSTQDLKFIPDYYLGCLIFYDEFTDDNMRWVCYDGRQRYRCVSRAAAMQMAAELSKLVTTEGIGHLMLSHHFLTRAWQAMDKAAAESDIETRLWLELKAVETHKLADAIDLLISQKSHNNQ